MPSFSERIIGDNPVVQETNPSAGGDLGNRLNALRAGVLGANDGIVSVAALLLGVIGSGMDSRSVLAAGLASTIAGAVSMAVGEYVSVSSQRDTEKALVRKETWELAEDPQGEHDELAGMLEEMGMSADTASTAATEINSRGVEITVPVHLKLEFGLDSEDLTNPWIAAGASAISFLLGAALPMLSVFFAGAGNGALMVTATTLIALAVTGYVSGKLSKANPWRAVLRLVLGGALGLAITYGVGALFGVAA
ncbi:VIT1/CCC1 transporter family protein [Corynebacterium guangdongense]|uniref:VIT1/CCC1 family predicted Fe2+/Mn2+ transporter n=1 Tax=Corynebacterium guangdongense TaxID=1783348 RepID=A0ABU1ZXY8_9CORY|nr:VIT family protein [Corynebacterium guangdongense]MDR7329798.1 VIT1/CCC1 family predicted Fe2+/Mn2+ transporter [Corynebacterium guangdongense]WJZ18361.1 VIT family protein [Corynebacterium guangdongense]